MSRADFSLFIVSFAAALALFFGLAQEPWENIGLLLIFIALLGLMGAHLKGGACARKVSFVALVFAIGFAWAQFATLAQQRGTGIPQFERGDQAIIGEVIWGEPRPLGSLIDLRVKDPTGRAFDVRLYGNRDLASRLRPGCVARIKVSLSPLSKPSVIGGYDPRFSAWFNGRRGQGAPPWIAATGAACWGMTGALSPI